MSLASLLLHSAELEGDSEGSPPQRTGWAGGKFGRDKRPAV